jgi:hypothetical protein
MRDKAEIGRTKFSSVLPFDMDEADRMGHLILDDPKKRGWKRQQEKTRLDTDFLAYTLC